MSTKNENDGKIIVPNTPLGQRIIACAVRMETARRAREASETAGGSSEGKTK